MSALSVKDHLEGILSDFEALKRSFDMEDVDDVPVFSPSSPHSSSFSPSPSGMILTGNGESRRSSGSHQPLYQSHISISSNSSPAHSPVLKTRVSSSLSFNRGTIQIARSNGSTRSSLTRVASFQTRLSPNGFSTLGPGSDSESLHSSTSSLECQPATKLITPLRPSQIPLGQPEASIRISKISSPVLKTFSSHGSVFHSEIERPSVRLVPMASMNHNSLPSLDLHIAEDQGSDLIPSPDAAYPSAAAWNAPTQSCTVLLTKDSKSISREPSFSSSSSSSSPPPDASRWSKLTDAPLPVLRPNQSQLNKLQKFPISLEGLDEKPVDGPSSVPGIDSVFRPLPKTQLKVSLHANTSIQTKPSPQQPMLVVKEDPAEPIEGMPLIPSPVHLPTEVPVGESHTSSLSSSQDSQFQLVSQLQTVQGMSPGSCSILLQKQQESTPVQPVPKDNLRSMIERANSFTQADGPGLKSPTAISILQQAPHSGKLSRSFGGSLQEKPQNTEQTNEDVSLPRTGYNEGLSDISFVPRTTAALAYTAPPAISSVLSDISFVPRTTAALAYTAPPAISSVLSDISVVPRTTAALAYTAPPAISSFRIAGSPVTFSASPVSLTPERSLEPARISMAEPRRWQQVPDREMLPTAYSADQDVPGSEPFGYVGIEAVLDQMRRKTMKTGFEFNIMVVGQSGLGKSTLVNTLFKSKICRKSGYEKIPKTVELRAVSHVIEENGLKMRLTVIDTPGFGDQINNQNCWDPIIKYIAEQYEKYLREEIVIKRKRRIPDSRIHCCIYFVPPTGHWLRPLDVEFMKRLSKIVNIVPVIAKADTLTLEEREEFKQQIRKDLLAYGISVYPQRELDEDMEETILNDRIREKIPFAVVGTDQEHQVNGKRVLGRKTNWGLIEVENVAHCEFANLRDLLIRTNLQDLKDITHYIHYESYRIRRLNESNLLPQSPEHILYSPTRELMNKEELENNF
ncbi:septin-12 isoform X2 [Rhinatrema bivittatum]|uniref:septin-12 isoform X2 n=1 Tax=Rhinatrema bivittatum TaxID=194408 RepID=UPI001128B9AD|nr:septin-12 isoform X2 [Rhinatrema bivittatum]